MRPKRSRPITKTVARIHFEDFDGTQFERLVFAYHLRDTRWRTLQWFGQVGSDLGRDIIGVCSDDNGGFKRICIQCVNRKQLTYTKASRDITKAVNATGGKPHIFRFVCASLVSAKLRDRIQQHAASVGVHECETWSGPEFEERLRLSGESLLRRFVDGEVFPDDPAQLAATIAALHPVDDQECLYVMARLFDRPAFWTPFSAESSILDFKQAITDTIQAINTGLWQTRAGQPIARVPSKHEIRDATKRAVLDSIVNQLADLRTRFEDYMASGEIDNCNNSGSHLHVSPQAGREMDAMRRGVLAAFGSILPSFAIRMR